MGDYNNVRRYYHRQRLGARATGDTDIEGVWRWKQEQQPGTALPETFVYLAELAAAGYTTIEDLDGADEYELTHVAQLRGVEARAVMLAYALLVAVPA